MNARIDKGDADLPALIPMPKEGERECLMRSGGRLEGEAAVGDML